ncbi:hypothetical protein GCM10022226_68460 [Sphaerisporangium flaviroseum]|uniref:Alanyl-tRNA synthetase class IIc N-terminal domain-containing protein n=1 Tax=Sphaerisporangium flaviroseum TaxID=509199 RepID=A0ABP7J8R1_9ACTN
MARQLTDDHLPVATRLRRNLERLTADFTGHFLREGAEELVPEPTVPRDDPTVLFTNSAVVAFKPYLRGELALGGRTLVVTQPCVRAHNLKTMFAEAFAPEFVLQFTMLAALAPDGAALTRAIARFFGGTLNLDGSQVLMKAASDDHDLHTGWPAGWSPPVARDTERRRYYRWKFGEPRMTGRGATFAIAQGPGRWRDLGNLIAFEWDGRTVGYGFGIGLETLAACLGRSRWVIDAMPIGALPPAESEQEAKLADLLGLLARLYHNGIAVSGRAQGYIMRKALIALDHLAAGLGVPERELLARMRAIAVVQGRGEDLAGALRGDLERLRSRPEAVRSLDLSLRCRREVTPETLCAAIDRIAVPDVLSIESSISDVWRGPSLGEDEHSVTISLALSTRHPMRPPQVRAALRTVTRELAEKYGVVLRGQV